MAKEKERQLKIKGGDQEQQSEENGKKEKGKKKKNKLSVLILLIVTVLASLVFSIQAKGGIKGIFSRKDDTGRVENSRVEEVKESESKDSWWPFGKKVYEFN